MQRTPVQALERVPVFREVERPDLVALAKIARPRVFRPRSVVVRQGEPGTSLFVIDAGYCSVSMEGPAGSLSTLGIMGPGEIFGELSLLDGGPRSATVTTLTRSEMIVIDRAHFVGFVEANPRVAVALLEVLAKRVRRLSERSDDQAGRRISSRLAKQLLLLADTHGQPLGTGRVRIALKLSQQELGALVGATRESVNKHLRLWRAEKILDQEGGHLVVSRVDVLRSMASD